MKKHILVDGAYTQQCASNRFYVEKCDFFLKKRLKLWRLKIKSLFGELSEDN